MMVKNDIADEWMRANGHYWKPAKHPNETLKPKHEKTVTGQGVRRRRMKATEGASAVWDWTLKKDRQTIKAFVEEHRDFSGHECVFVPGAQKNVPAQVKYLGRSMAAARYMCLLTHGTPKVEGAIARHKCGNGHLSCVNPSHIVWGQPGDNIGDANIHRAMDGATVEDKCRAVDARTSK